MARADEARATLSVAAVLKKDGVHLWKILESVPFNEMIVLPDVLTGSPVDYGLQGAVRICQASVLTIPSSLESHARPEQRLYLRGDSLVLGPLHGRASGPRERASYRLGAGSLRAP